MQKHWIRKPLQEHTESANVSHSVRFIVRNSVEQDDYEGAYGKIQGGQLNKYSLVVQEFERKKVQKDKKRKEFDEELASELEELNNPSPKKKRSISTKKKTPAKAQPKKRSFFWL